MERKRYVTPTGRAISPGTVTRRTLAYRRPPVRPLPMWLQCHPKAQKHTPLHPGCATYNPKRLAFERFCANGPATTWGFVAGVGLTVSPDRARIEVDGATYYTDDLVYGLIWTDEARRAGLTAAVYPNRL